MQKNTKISPMRPRDGPRSTRYPISSYTRTRWLSPSVVSYTLLHGTGAFPAERGGRPYRTSTMPDAEWEVPRSWKRRGRGRHESREYDRKANNIDVIRLFFTRFWETLTPFGRPDSHGGTGPPQVFHITILTVTRLTSSVGSWGLFKRRESAR